MLQSFTTQEISCILFFSSSTELSTMTASSLLSPSSLPPPSLLTASSLLPHCLLPPSSLPPHCQQIEACNQEAIKLGTLINNRTPMLASDPLLSHLIAARVETSRVEILQQVQGKQEGVANPNSAHQTGLSLSVMCLSVCVSLLSIFLFFRNFSIF